MTQIILNILFKTWPDGVMLPFFATKLLRRRKLGDWPETELGKATMAMARTPARTPRTGICSFRILKLVLEKPMFEKFSMCVCIPLTCCLLHFLAQNFDFTTTVVTLSPLSFSSTDVGCSVPLFWSFLNDNFILTLFFFSWREKKIDFGNYFNVCRCRPQHAWNELREEKSVYGAKKLRHKIQGLGIDLVAKNRSNVTLK